MLKRILSIALSFVMVLSLAGCKNDENKTFPDTSATTTTAIVSDTTTTTATDITTEAITSEVSDITTEITTEATTEVTTETTTEATTTEITTDAATTPLPVEDETPQTKFVYASGIKLYEPSGEEYLIRGMAFGNEVWGNPSTPSAVHHDEQSYKEISELGFNSVRFYLNYGLFEDDSNPYIYKESGFEWLDKNIAWAKKYGIRLVLNMHYPQGGYQSQGNGMALWTDAENQNRLIALWKEIARRYADEEYILGYGFINEPVVPKLDTDAKTVGQVQSLMQRITDAVREVDKNHLVFIERMCATKDESGNSHWVPGEFLINDDNAVYEFHAYTPHSFTHQDMDWAGTEGNIAYYPSDTMQANYTSYWEGCKESAYKLTEGNWHYFESDKVSRTDSYNIGSVTFLAANIGEGKTVYLDDVVITEYDKNGNVIKTYEFNMTEAECAQMYFWSQDGKGSAGYASDFGRSENGCLYIKDTTSDANATGLKYELKEGNFYSISGWVNYGNSTSTSRVKPRIDYSQADSIMYLDKNYLEHTLLSDLDFYHSNNVPVYMGEFGTCTNSFKDNRGGEQWVTDMLSLLEKYSVSYNYHTYHEGAFGLHTNSGKITSQTRNEVLAEIFRKYQN